MSSQQKRILVAEDNPALAGVIRFNLERAGLHVTVARNGREAWGRLETNSYDLVVTDHQMPEMTGYELCRRMRRHEQHVATPVIMLTGKGLELELAKLKDELGVKAVIAKPFSPLALIQAIEQHLSAGLAAAEPSMAR